MNFAWAIEQLNKGNKVRRSSWENQAFFLYKNTVNNIIYQHGSDCGLADDGDVRCSLSSSEVFADDWENHACPTAKEFCPTAKENDWAWAVGQIKNGKRVTFDGWRDECFIDICEFNGEIIKQDGKMLTTEEVKRYSGLVGWRLYEKPDCRPGSVLFVKDKYDKHMDIHDRIENDLRDLKVHTHPDVGLMVNTLNRLESQLKILEGRVNGISSDFYNHKHTISAPKQGD